MEELNGGRSKARAMDNGWKSFGAGSSSSSMHAISFGFVATAVLISMFLIIAIFEHLFRPKQSQNDANDHALSMEKLRNLQQVSKTAAFAREISVMMPGQQCPTYIAHPSPLIPCSREPPVLWPSHHHHHH